ncbi:FAD/FMN-containing dehydrogenase [Acinetobacter calcoaceticus]|uniref:D-2-hydroxyglutarate dehydrogenase n=1 Tax=Acinetobacter calcoaceticus TaxID=471 RepID=A0A4R1XQ72_ACICA|nr:FAD/FMN-containing dehydrogenase [Acinetobacter calcoaceticus]
MKNIDVPLTHQYLNELRSILHGEIDQSEAAQAVYATDNSIYQWRPQGIIYPKNIEDLQLILKLANTTQYRQIVLTPRGGGTGTNGQSLTNGVVVDLSRHMNQILHIDPIAQTAWVQAGVVKDQLNAALKAHGLFFAPELSTSNRATIGGMINTDASGQGSCRYGKTHHHVLALTTVLNNGEVLASEPIAVAQFDAAIADKSPLQQQIYRQVLDMVSQHQDLIQANFPNLNRSLTGYDLPASYDGQQLNINNLLCGSEGTLGFIATAKLNLLKIPQHRALINIGYAQFQDALNDAKALMQLAPLSIETVDSKVLNLAKQDMVWQNVAPYFPENTEQPVQGINLVEIDADSIEALQHLQQQFLAHLANDPSVKRLSMTVAHGAEQIKHVYAMRKRAVGLLGNVAGERRPQPFVEDTAVPPEHLAAYIAEFRALLDGHGLDYGMFGHVDAGVLHVRPLLDMKLPESAQIVQQVSDQIVELTHKYGGVIWGEHGKGLRSGYAEVFFGAAYPLIQKVKGLFDPHNQLNPGKIATPDTQPDARLIGVIEVPLRGDADRQIKVTEWNEFANTMHCNGNGACFNYDLDDPMCPSYKVTRNRIHSPKGRATLIKEWLRREHLGEHKAEFDHEVYDALHGCLSCKSCAGQCPVKVDIPDSKARFLARYHQRHRRSMRDYLVSHLEQFMPKLVSISGLYNLMQKMPLVKVLQRNLFKMVDIPLFHPQAKQDLAKYGATLLDHDLKDLSNAVDRQQAAVILVQDAFTRYFDTGVLIETLQFIQAIGVKVYILPYLANAKPLHVHGFLAEFEQKRAENSRLLEQAAASGLPLIGLDPAMTLVYRQEYKSNYNDVAPNFEVQVQLLQEWLSEYLAHLPATHNAMQPTATYYLAGHCTERTQATASTAQWQQIFQHFGLELQSLALGCCGMSGTYGHESEHRELSAKIYQQSWQQQRAEYADRLLVTGYSCRSQIKRLDNATAKHPVQILAERVQ